MPPLAAIDVVLVRPQGAVNVGAVARVVKNFGAGGLVLVAPEADVRGREARMFADRAQDVLQGARVVASLDEALVGGGVSVGTSSKIREARDGAPLTPALARLLLPRAAPPPGAWGGLRVDIRHLSNNGPADGVASGEPSGRLRLVFGNEAQGLTLQEARSLTRVVRLPAEDAYDSFNLSHAVAVALSAFAFAADDEGAPAAASPEEVERLRATWSTALRRAGYFRRNTAEAFAPRLRALLDRLRPSSEDAALLHDMLAVLGRAATAGAVDDDATAAARDEGAAT